MADETHHRDVNHTFADMKSDDPNPFLLEHKENAAIAWRLELTGESAWTETPGHKTPSATGTADNGHNSDLGSSVAPRGA